MYKSATAVPKAICPACPALSGSFRHQQDNTNGQPVRDCGSLSGLSGRFSIALRMRARASHYFFALMVFFVIPLGFVFYPDKPDKEIKGFVFARFFVSGCPNFQPDTTGQAGQVVR